MTILERVVIIAITSIHFLTAWFKWMERKICALQQWKREDIYPVFRKPKVTLDDTQEALSSAHSVDTQYTGALPLSLLSEGRVAHSKPHSWLMTEAARTHTWTVRLWIRCLSLAVSLSREPVCTTFLIPFKSWPDSFCHSARKKKKEKTSSTMM